MLVCSNGCRAPVGKTDRNRNGPPLALAEIDVDSQPHEQAPAHA